MFTKIKIAFALSAGLLGIAGIAAAEDGAPPAAERSAKHAAMKQKMLEKFDLNKDGKLDPAERKLMKEQRLETRFKTLDKNGDGVISFEEFKSGNLARGGKHGGHHRHGGMKPGFGSGGSQP
jgi:hypothetical protein